MKLVDFIDPSKVEINVPFGSKKRLFEQLANRIGRSKRQTRRIYDSLVAREKLGNTSLGNGVALPHGNCLKEKEVRCCIFAINNPVNYETVDNSMVQLIVCFAFPIKFEESHCELLKEAGQFFKKHRLYRELISAKTAKDLVEIIIRESK
jgi:PTS system nitrogen regulatory IIA component